MYGERLRFDIKCRIGLRFGSGNAVDGAFTVIVPSRWAVIVTTSAPSVPTIVTDSAPSAPTQELLSAYHRQIYDGLASQYVARVAETRNLTETSLRRFVQYLEPGASVLDVGCGAGSVVEILCDLNFRADGIDISPNMVAAAVARNPSASIIHADFMKYEPPEKYDGMVAFAFIHLFPKPIALEVLRRMRGALRPGGHILIGTTRSEVSWEGFIEKSDYVGTLRRYRKFWVREEFEAALLETGFAIKAMYLHEDPYGKVWLDYTAQAV